VAVQARGALRQDLLGGRVAERDAALPVHHQQRGVQALDDALVRVRQIEQAPLGHAVRSQRAQPRELPRDHRSQRLVRSRLGSHTLCRAEPKPLERSGLAAHPLHHDHRWTRHAQLLEDAAAGVAQRFVRDDHVHASGIAAIEAGRRVVHHVDAGPALEPLQRAHHARGVLRGTRRPRDHDARDPRLLFDPRATPHPLLRRPVQTGAAVAAIRVVGG
jgi:hypothetical protein